MTRSIKPLALSLGAAGFILATAVASPIDQAQGAPPQIGPVEVEVVNTPLEVIVSDDPSTDVLGFSNQITDGVAGGVGGLSQRCQNTFTEDARVCTSAEVPLFPGITSLVAGGPGWVQPVISSSGIIYRPGSLDFLAWTKDISDHLQSFVSVSATVALEKASLSCSDWDVSSTDFRGLIYDVSIGFTGLSCFDAAPVLCCGPVP